jgi:hypothetical protein
VIDVTLVPRGMFEGRVDPQRSVPELDRTSVGARVQEADSAIYRIIYTAGLEIDLRLDVTTLVKKSATILHRYNLSAFRRGI